MGPFATPKLQGSTGREPWHLLKGRNNLCMIQCNSLLVNTHVNSYVMGHIWVLVLLICLKMVNSEKPSSKCTPCIYANLYLNIKCPSRGLNDTKKGFKVTRFFKKIIILFHVH